MLRPFAHPVACCWEFLHKVWTGQTFELTTPNISFVPCSPKRSVTMLDRFAQPFPTLLGIGKRITHGLQSLTGCILPMMHCRSQHYWELFRPFAHHCQHGRSNFQHGWPNNVGSCCVRLHVAFSSWTANIGPIVPALPDILSHLKVGTH